MYRLVMPHFHSTITYECLDQVSVNCHLVKEDNVVLPNSSMLIDHPPLGKIFFYLYYFEAGLFVPPLSFFGQIMVAYKIHIC